MNDPSMGADTPAPDDPFLRVLAEHWDGVLSMASEEQRQKLRGLVAGSIEPDPLDARALLADELLDLLPPDHPIVQVMRTGTMYAGTHEDSAPRVAESLRRLRMRLLPSDAPHAAPDEFDREVRARLLDLPFLSPEELRNRDVDPNGRGLIRLPRPDRAVQFPAFQFTKDGPPWHVVQEVNERLNAVADPWGVTCWWVDPHAGLDAIPANLLGTGEDDLILRAAAAVGEG